MISEIMFDGHCQVSLTREQLTFIVGETVKNIFPLDSYTLIVFESGNCIKFEQNSLNGAKLKNKEYTKKLISDLVEHFKKSANTYHELCVLLNYLAVEGAVLNG